jgi:predicted DNA-binding protein (UPF0251 family)
MNNPPHFKGFRPIGLPEENNPVVINYEEYEAIRLSDYELNGHVEAAQKMGISRPTYTRIYESARRKVALAFVEGKAIVFEGGKVYFDSDWYACNHCGCWFNHPEKEQEINNCSLCGSTNIVPYSESIRQPPVEEICICPNCGSENMPIQGTICGDSKCPVCNYQMIRKGIPNHHGKKNESCN